MNSIEETLYNAKIKSLESIRNAADLLLSKDTKKVLVIHCTIPLGCRITFEDNNYAIVYGWDMNEDIELVRIEEIVNSLKEGNYEIQNR